MRKQKRWSQVHILTNKEEEALVSHIPKSLSLSIWKLCFIQSRIAGMRSSMVYSFWASLLSLPYFKQISVQYLQDSLEQPIRRDAGHPSGLQNRHHPLRVLRAVAQKCLKDPSGPCAQTTHNAWIPLHWNNSSVKVFFPTGRSPPAILSFPVLRSPFLPLGSVGHPLLVTPLGSNFSRDHPRWLD